MLKNMYEAETCYEKELPITIDGMQGTALLSKENVALGGLVNLKKS